jgi:hypothetical protein
MTVIEAARRAFLLALCEEMTSTFVSRSYLAEKVERIYRAQDVSEIRAMLSPTRSQSFDRHLRASGFFVGHAP